MVVEPTPLSASNPRIASLRRLSGRRKARLEAGRFVIEGPVPIAELLAAGADLDELYVDLDQWAQVDDRSPLRSVVRDADAAGVPVWGLTSSVFASDPQALITARKTIVKRKPSFFIDFILSIRPKGALIEDYSTLFFRR